MACKLFVLSSLLVIAALIFSQYGSQDDDSPPLNNFDGNCYFNPEKVHTPSQLQEIQDIVKKANQARRKIKVLGTGHSRSAIALSEDLYLSLHNYRGLVNIDVTRKLATFRGGTRLWEILRILDNYNLTLPILPAIGDQTISGALVTATHGTGVNTGNMVNYLDSLTLVTPSGEVISISRDTDSELFHAAGVSLGLLGVVTEVTLQCVDAFNLKESRVSHSLSYCLEHLPALAAGADHVKFWIEFNSKTCYVFSANKTHNEPRDTPSDTLNSIKMIIWEVFQWFFSLVPQLTSTGMSLLFSTNFFFPSYQRIDHNWNVHIVTHYMSPNRQAEIAVPFENCADAIKDLITVLDENKIPLNHILEVRFVKSDQFWLSTNYNRDSCHLTQMMYNPSEQNWYLFYKKFYDATLSYNGRPHWGKVFTISTTEIHQLYPKLGDFLKIRAKLDPQNIFVNELIKETFELLD